MNQQEINSKVKIFTELADYLTNVHKDIIKNLTPEQAEIYAKEFERLKKDTKVVDIINSFKWQ